MGSFVGSDTAGGNVSSLSVTWPATDAGDVALLFWQFLSSETPTGPGGAWTTEDDYTANSGAARMFVYSRECDGAETGDITVSNGVANRQTLLLWIARGFASFEGFSRFDETVSQTTHDCPAYTTVAADVGIVVAFLERATTGTTTATEPSGFASNPVDTDSLALGSGGTFIDVASDDLVTSRSGGTNVDPGNFTADFASANAVTYTIALAPAAAVAIPNLFTVRSNLWPG